MYVTVVMHNYISMGFFYMPQKIMFVVYMERLNYVVTTRTWVVVRFVRCRKAKRTKNKK